MAIALVQSAHISNYNNGSNFSVSFANPPTPGNCLVAVLSVNMGTVSASAPSAPKINGVSFSVGDTEINNNPTTNGQAIGIFYLANNTQTTTSVSFTVQGSAFLAAGWIYEFSGVTTSSPLVSHSGYASTSQTTSWNTNALTATTGNLLIGAVGGPDANNSSYVITSPGSPWTNLTGLWGVFNSGTNQNGVTGWTITASGSQSYNASAAAIGAQYYAGCIIQLSAAPVAVNVPAAAVTIAAQAPAPIGRILNQWSASFSQPASFQTTPPALQHVEVPLTAATSVGGGSGVPTAGTWLFAITGISEQSAAAGVTVEAHDDIHSYWRPGKVSTSTALTRTSVWYTANTARVPGYVYVSPNGACTSMSVLVIEVAGLGPWDTVTGVASNYAAAATSLSLSLGAPSAQAFVLAAAAGDLSTAGQALAGSGWSPLTAVSVTNGSDHTCDSVLTAAWEVTSSSASISASASSATDLSGVIIGILTSAPSPVPAGQNPNWPFIIVEEAFGSGLQTPADQMTWTALNNWTNGVRRFWLWNDDSGVPYALGQLQSATGENQLDNADGALSPANSASPYFGQLLPGTPIRLRMALGTVGGITYNRWYIVQRNALAYPEKRNKILRDFVPLTLTDAWSAVTGSCPSPYRGEVEQDAPYSWYPCDDQPLAGGVLPTQLLNLAAGNSNPLVVHGASGGVTAGDAYSTSGTDLSSAGSGTPPPSIATYAVAAESGWMYGDPTSAPGSAPTGAPVEASAGAAAWQQSGLAGSGGANGYFLAVNDAGFPALSSGVSFGIAFKAAFFGSATGATITTNRYNIAGQPYSVITLATLATASAPVAVLQLDLSGHLVLITYNGVTPTSNTIYSASDLRSNDWHTVMLTTTTTVWHVYVDGGLTATVSGTATGMTSAWNWLLVNADCGTSGGSSLASAQHMGNVAYSHIQVFPSILPAWRIRAHYCAALTGFGLIPAPQSVQASAVAQQFGGASYVPDGSEFQGSYGLSTPFSAVVAAQAGSYTSGPSARAVVIGTGTTGAGSYGAAIWVGWTGLAPSVQVYTAAAAMNETDAATVCGSGDSFINNYGASASGHGVCQTAAGTGASPPAAASQLGDTVAQRIERIFGYAGLTGPNRAIDATASLAVQAALDIGGTPAGSSLQNLVDSDNGLMFIDNCGTRCYKSRPHLAADQVVWFVGMNVAGGNIPFAGDITPNHDPQQVFTDVKLTPYSPEGASLPSLTPQNAAAAEAAQLQYGPKPKSITSYLQDQTKIQAAANWWFAQYGQTTGRIEQLTIDAASHPAAWGMVCGANVSDLVSVYDAPFGIPASTTVYRISKIKRSISNSANETATEAKIQLQLDYVPTSYWS